MVTTLDHCVDVIVFCVERAVAAGADHEAGFGSYIVNQLGYVVIHFTRRAERQHARGDVAEQAHAVVQNFARFAHVGRTIEH